MLAGIMLPRVPGRENAFILPFAPQTAHADESEPFEVLVLSRSMFAVVVVDVANKMKPLANAQVTLTSRYASGKSLTATTDADGTAIFEVGPLSEDYVDDSTPLDSYEFNGGISVRATGYRDVEIPLSRIQGGTAVTAPTQALSDGQPYFRQLTFDEWDIQYSQSTFLMPPGEGSANATADAHAFEVEAYLPQGGQAVLRASKVMPAQGTQPEQVTLLGKISANAQQPSNIATFTLEDTYLDKASGSLEDGCSLRFELEYQGETYRLDSAMSVATSPIEKAEAGNAVIVPETTKQEIAPIDFPSGFPVIGGSKFTCWIPQFPILFDFSFAGYVVLGVGAVRSYKNDSGNIDPEYWKKAPRESGKKQLVKYLTDMGDACDKYDNMTAAAGTNPKHSSFFQHSCAPKFAIDLAAQLYGSLKYDWVGKKWGDNSDPAMSNIHGLLQAKADLIWNVQCSAGPVPFFLVINPWVLAKLALSAGCHTHGSGADFFKNITCDFSQTSAAFTIQIGLAITAGIGVAGCVSVGVRGAGAITFYIGYENPGNKQLPRLRVGATVDTDVVVQVLLFKWSSKIYSGKWPTLCDSWSESTSNSENQYQLRRSELALGENKPYTLESRVNGAVNADTSEIAEFIKSATIVTNEELLKRAELEAVAENTSLLVRDWNDVVKRIERGADAESDDEGTFEMYEHKLVSVTQNETPLYTYNYIGTASNAEIGETANEAGVSESDRGGLKPSVDKVLFEGVLSEARLKMLTVNDVPCLFRIASVRYGDQGRSRLVVHTKSNGVWSTPQPIDFSLGFGEGDITRADVFDYDFDAAAYAIGKGTEDAYVLLISGDRPKGDNTTFDTASTANVVSVVRLRVAEGRVSVVSHTSWRSISKGNEHDENNNGYHSLQCPRITAGKTLVDGRLTGAYLNRSGATKAAALGSEASVALECFALWADGESLVFRQVYKFKQEQQKAQAPSSIELGEPESQNGKMIVPVAYECAGGCGLVAYAVTLQAISGWGHLSPDSTLQRLMPWSKHGGFLATKDERLQHITWSRGDSAFTVEPVGPAGCGPASFGVSANGMCVMYCENTDGEVGQTYDESGEPVPIEGKAFRIYASTLAGGLFTEPFVLCELDHPVDQLATCVTSAGMLSALCTRIVSAETSEAKLHGIEMPLVACATPLGAVADLGAVVPGTSSEPFVVTVRNDGNTLLSEGVVDLYREDSGKPFSNAAISFGAANRVASIHDPELAQDWSANDTSHLKYELGAMGQDFAEHPLVKDNENAVLAPGKTAQFRLNFSIPQSWESDIGKRVKLYAKIRDLVAIDPVTLDPLRSGTNSELGSVLHELHIPDEACQRSEAQVGACWRADSSGLCNAPMVAQSDDGGGKGSGGSSDVPANTGDPCGPIAAGAAALAALGAAFAAYSARRTALEREGDDGTYASE